MRNLLDHELALVSGGASSAPPGPTGNPSISGGVPVGSVGGGTISVGGIGGFPPSGGSVSISFPTGGGSSGGGTSSGGGDWASQADRLRDQNDRDSGKQANSAGG